MRFSWLRKTSPNHKLILGITALSLTALLVMFVIVNTLVRAVIYENVVGIALRDNIIYAAEVDAWFGNAGQTVSSLATALSILPSEEHFPAIAAGFNAAYYFVENVFIGFADGSVFNGIGWTPSNVGADLGGVGWGPWEHWAITDRPWFTAAQAAGDGVLVSTEPYFSLTMGTVTTALAKWVPGLGGVGASVGFSLSMDSILDRIGAHPVMADGYLMLVAAGGEIVFHPNPAYAPSPDGTLWNIRDIPNGTFIMDSIAAKLSAVKFDDSELGPSYFLAVPLEVIDWTLIAVIPAWVAHEPVLRYMVIIMAPFALVLLALFAFTMLFVSRITRSMEERSASEERMRLIFDHMPLVAAFRDKNFKVRQCNAEVPKLFGLENRMDYFDRFPELSPAFQPDGRRSKEKAEDMIAQAFETGNKRFEWMHRKLSGEPIPCEVTLIRVGFRGGDYLVTLIRDLREFYAVQKQERILMQRIRAMVDSSPLACAILDESFKVLEVNQELLKLFELGDRQVYIDRFFEFSPKYQPDGRFSREKMREKARLALGSGKAHFEWMYQTLEGEPVPCEMTVVCIANDEKKLLIAYIRDLREINDAIFMVKQLELLAFTDALTGARNRRYFTETAERELHACVTEGRDFALILFDIDHFKRVNDTYGHDTGDEVLRIVVARTRHSLKQDTVLARYGGEEFAIMLPDVTHENAVKIAWQLQKRIQATPFSTNGVEVDVTISLGVASKTASCAALQDIIKNADKALYQAKETGRNKVISCDAAADGDAAGALTP